MGPMYANIAQQKRRCPLNHLYKITISFLVRKLLHENIKINDILLMFSKYNNCIQHIMKLHNAVISENILLDQVSLKVHSGTP